jgi:hypothetical protein
MSVSASDVPRSPTRTYLSLAFCFLGVFGAQTASKKSENSDQPKKTATNRQAAAQQTVKNPPAATVSNTTFIYKPTPDENQKARDEKPKHDWVDHINSFSTGVIAAFTVLMFVVVYRQDQTTKISERAWVVSNTPGSPQRSEDKVQVVCKIMNTGRTPAWITLIGSSAQFVKSEEDLPRIPNYPVTTRFGQRGSVLTPHGHTEAGVSFETKRLEYVERGEVILYFYGFVEYRDAFNQTHMTRYCYRLKRSQDLTSQSLFEFYVDGPGGYNTAD